MVTGKVFEESTDVNAKYDVSVERATMKDSRRPAAK